MSLRRFLVFGYGSDEEAGGGLNDVIGSFDTVEEALDCVWARGGHQVWDRIDDVDHPIGERVLFPQEAHANRMERLGYKRREIAVLTCDEMPDDRTLLLSRDLFDLSTRKPDGVMVVWDKP